MGQYYPQTSPSYLNYLTSHTSFALTTRHVNVSKLSLPFNNFWTRIKINSSKKIYSFNLIFSIVNTLALFKGPLV